LDVIFNVGSRRSGTFWLQRIVTAHPAVGSVPSETHLLSHGIAPLLERFQHTDPGSTEVGRVYLPRDELIASVRGLCDLTFRQFQSEGESRVAERTPLHAFHLELINEIYPEAQFVHIIRDGRDVARSIAAQDWGPETVADAAAEWRDAVTAARAAGLSPDRYREVRYEALLADPDAEIASLYDWLGLPTANGELDIAIAESARPENVDRFGIGGVASQKWRSSFTDSDLAAFTAVAGDLIDELGYSPTPKPRSMAQRAVRRLRRHQPGSVS
jgi:hypothetical protein